MDTRKAISSAADVVLGSPLRNLVIALAFVGTVFTIATIGSPPDGALAMPPIW